MNFEEATKAYFEALRTSGEKRSDLIQAEARVSYYKALLYGAGAEVYWKGQKTVGANHATAGSGPAASQPAPAAPPPATPDRPPSGTTQQSQNENNRTQNESAAGAEGVYEGVIVYVHEKTLSSAIGPFTKFGIKFDDGTEKGFWINTIKKTQGETALTYKDRGAPVVVVWKNKGYGPEVVSIEPAHADPPPPPTDDIPF